MAGCVHPHHLLQYCLPQNYVFSQCVYGGEFRDDGKRYSKARKRRVAYDRGERDRVNGSEGCRRKG